MNGWNFDPLEISVLALVGALYWRRARTLARRGRAGAALCGALPFGAGLLTLFVALASPIDTIGEERLFSVHMLQHLLLGDVGALLLVLGLDGRLLRPLLRLRARPPAAVSRESARRAAALGRELRRWHVPALFDAALRNDAIHALQHTLFVAVRDADVGGAARAAARAGVVHRAVEDPLRPRDVARDARPLAGLHLVGPRLLRAVRARPTLWGLSHLDDQKAGGGVMLVESVFTMLPALVWVLLRVLRESEARQRLVDAGVAPAVAARAARYGRA